MEVSMIYHQWTDVNTRPLDHPDWKQLRAVVEWGWTINVLGEPGKAQSDSILTFNGDGEPVLVPMEAFK
jgi:hypothetical protein